MINAKKKSLPAPRKTYNEYILDKIKYQEDKIIYHQKRIAQLKSMLK